MNAHSLTALPAALDYIRKEKRITLVDFYSIMEFHILEVPGLEVLRKNLEQGEWNRLAEQMRVFSALRLEQLLVATSSSTNREELRGEALRILLLRKLAAAAGLIHHEAPEIDQ